MLAATQPLSPAVSSAGESGSSTETAARYQLEILSALSTAAVMDHEIVAAIARRGLSIQPQVIVAASSTVKTRLTTKPQPSSLLDYVTTTAGLVAGAVEYAVLFFTSINFAQNTRQAQRIGNPDDAFSIPTIEAVEAQDGSKDLSPNAPLPEYLIPC